MARTTRGHRHAVLVRDAQDGGNGLGRLGQGDEIRCMRGKPFVTGMGLKGGGIHPQFIGGELTAEPNKGLAKTIIHAGRLR